VPIVLVGVLVGLNLYRSKLALSPENLAEARQRWQAAGIKDYDITVTTSGGIRGTYRLKVRGGSVLDATADDVPLNVNTAPAQAWTVPGLFDALEQYLEWDSRPQAPTAYTEVAFDHADGHLVRYLRTAPGQHIVIDVQLERK
jgi:hypothetical protein